ncbi:oligoribonuclease [Alloscardovia theropitheci]|uniref:Oligoribonuclease n=1 Tax=Alloscardovia theropitheci TaxID=2496842 RepID=A0A4R0QUC2_9BIFI|nr:oligoribonuclease [Alloscardovia theropitheci]TCD54995.1 oligoribonuclease [Alloscardovia theropitheci]
MAQETGALSAEESRLIWIDCEMTGLDINNDELCEVSVVPTDFNMNVLDEGIDLVIKPSQAAIDHMNDFVRHMHTSSGLVSEWDNGLTLEEAEKQIVEYVKKFLPTQGNGKAHLAGNSIHSDKKFLDKYMPQLMSNLHYRIIDVSTLKELSRRWYPAVYENKPAKHGGHRALADIIESIDELRYYRQMMFVKDLPTEQEAQSGAQYIESTSLLRTYEKEGNALTDSSTPEKADY